MGDATLVDPGTPNVIMPASTFSSHEQMSPRTLILCFDGTADRFADQVSAYMRRSFFQALMDFPEYERRQAVLSAQEGGLRTTLLLPGAHHARVFDWMWAHLCDGTLAWDRDIPQRWSRVPFLSVGSKNPRSRCCMVGICAYYEKFSDTKNIQVPRCARSWWLSVPHAELSSW